MLDSTPPIKLGNLKTSLGDFNVQSGLRTSVLHKQMGLGIAEKVLCSFLLQGALTCAETPLSAPGHLNHTQTHTHLNLLSLLRLSSFIGTLFSGGNIMFCSHAVAGSYFL